MTWDTSFDVKHEDLRQHGGRARHLELARRIATRVCVGVFVRLSSRFGGDSSVRERDLDAGAAEVDHCDQRVGGVEAVGAV
jgi:hypothetical protein